MPTDHSQPDRLFTGLFRTPSLIILGAVVLGKTLVYVQKYISNSWAVTGIAIAAMIVACAGVWGIWEILVRDIERHRKNYRHDDWY